MMHPISFQTFLKNLKDFHRRLIYFQINIIVLNQSSIFLRFLNASTLIRTTQKVNNNAITLEKVGNVTLVAKQTINSISPANIISIPLQKLKRIINLYYGSTTFFLFTIYIAKIKS